VCGAHGIIAGLPTQADFGGYCKDKEVMMLEKIEKSLNLT
jgi:hypothetical protein